MGQAVSEREHASHAIKRGWGREGVRSEARAEQRLAPGGRSPHNPEYESARNALTRNLLSRHAKCDSYGSRLTSMVSYRFLRSAAVALSAYGVLGLFISAAMLVVGTTTFGQVEKLQATLENERVALVQ